MVFLDRKPPHKNIMYDVTLKFETEVAKEEFLGYIELGVQYAESYNFAERTGDTLIFTMQAEEVPEAEVPEAEVPEADSPSDLPPPPEVSEEVTPEIPSDIVIPEGEIPGIPVHPVEAEVETEAEVAADGSSAVERFKKELSEADAEEDRAEAKVDEIIDSFLDETK